MGGPKKLEQVIGRDAYKLTFSRLAGQCRTDFVVAKFFESARAKFRRPRESRFLDLRETRLPSRATDSRARCFTAHARDGSSPLQLCQSVPQPPGHPAERQRKRRRSIALHPTRHASHSPLRRAASASAASTIWTSCLSLSGSRGRAMRKDSAVPPRDQSLTSTAKVSRFSILRRVGSEPRDPAIQAGPCFRPTESPRLGPEK